MAVSPVSDKSDTQVRKYARRLIAVRFSALGDIAMTVPVIYSVARAYPDLEIIFVTRPFFGRMFINPPENVRVMTFDLKKEYKGLLGSLRIARELALIHADYVADLHDIARTKIITAWLRMHGAKSVTVDKSRGTRHKVYAGGQPQRQYIDRYFDVFRKLGFDARIDFKSVYQNDVEKVLPVEIKSPAVGIAPFARYTNKTYPPEKMRQVARMLAAKGVNVYLFGGRGAEADTLASWQEERITSLAGKFPLEEEIAVMGHLDVMVSMDSANQHLAGLAGTPVISIWGSTTPACGFLGFGQTTHDAVYLGLPCQPCTIAGSDKCPKEHMDCLRKLPEETIGSKVMAKL